MDVPKGPRPRYRAPAGSHRRRGGRGLAIFFVVVLVVVAAAAAYVERHQIKKLIESSPAPHKVLHKTAPVKPKVSGPPLMEVAAATAPWQLPVPVTEALVVPGPAGELLVAGGQTASGTSGNGAFLVSTATGKLALYANLVAGVHDVAGAVLAGEVYLFGGAEAAPTATVQSFSAPLGAASSQTVSASATGSLPATRAGDSAVLVGATAYVVGGYDGRAADGQVLATTDGTSFAVVAKLPVAVRDAAVSATGGQIYVFGGAAPGPGGWGPVAYIQHVDPVTGKATVVGRLPVPLEGAVAFNLSGRLYVAGGHGPAGWNGSVYGFQPATGKVIVAGHLLHPVSGPGVAVERGVAWLVGGDSASGAPSGWVQTVRLTSRVAAAPLAPGARAAKSPK